MTPKLDAAMMRIAVAIVTNALDVDDNDDDDDDDDDDDHCDDCYSYDDALKMTRMSHSAYR